MGSPSPLSVLSGALKIADKFTLAMEAIGNKIRLNSQGWEDIRVIGERQVLMVVAHNGVLYLMPEHRPAKFENIDTQGLHEAGLRARRLRMSNASRRDCNSVTFDPDRLTFAEAGSSQEAKRWADSKMRVREHRQRKKLKLMQRTIRISPDQVTKLIALGYLGSRGDEKVEACAIEAYLADNLS